MTLHKMPMPLQKLLCAALLALTSMAHSFEEQLGRLRLSEAFPDAQVSSMVAAARSGDFREVDQLIANGADVNYRGVQGITPLAWLVAARDMRAVKHLLDAKADPNLKLQRNASPLSIAVELGSSRMLELLLAGGGNANLLGQDNDPLLHIAAIKQRKDQIDVLLKYGADINAISSRDQSTAAAVAIAVGRFDLAVYLVERGLSRDLQKLGAAAEGRVVPKTSEQQRRKDQLIAMLKERGVKFPALVRRVVPPPKPVKDAGGT